VAGRSHTSLFVVAEGTPWTVPIDLFNELANTTGGLVQLVNPYIRTEPAPGTVDYRPTPDLLDASFVRAFDEFRSSYVVAYAVTGAQRAGWHDVQIRIVKPGRTYQIRARQRYFVARDGS
jgi:hypothetical protein